MDEGKVSSTSPHPSRCPVLARSLLEFQPGTTSLHAQARSMGRHSTDTAKPSKVFPSTSQYYHYLQVLYYKESFLKKKSIWPCSLGPLAQNFFNLPRSYGSYTPPALPLQSWCRRSPMSFGVHMAHHLTTPTGNHTDPLLRSGTSPALLKSFRSHLILKIFYYKLPTISFSSLHLKDFAFTSQQGLTAC